MSSNETIMLRALRRRYDSALNLLEQLYPFECEIERASDGHWAARAIRRKLIEGGRLRPNAGPRKHHARRTPSQR